MSDVYSNAYLNIASSALPDSSGSLFQDRVCYFGDKYHEELNERNRLPIDTYTQWVLDDKDVQCPVTVRYSMDRAHRHLCGEAMSTHGVEAPLLDRGWVFQERMLSRRTVYISSSELLWECRSGYNCECGEINNPVESGPGSFEWEIGAHGPMEVDDSHYSSPKSKKVEFADVCLSKASSKEALGFWRTMMKEYSTLVFTRESDRDIALSGIRESFRMGRDLTYYAGIWIEDLPKALLWSTFGRPVSSVKFEKGMNAPSWSWFWRKATYPPASTWPSPQQMIVVATTSWNYNDLATFKKDDRVSFYIPDDAYKTYHDQPLIPPTIGPFPLHLTAPFLRGSFEIENTNIVATSFSDHGPLNERIKAYGEGLNIKIDLDFGGRFISGSRKGYCVLLGHTEKVRRRWDDRAIDTQECMLWLEEIPSPDDERRYVRKGLVEFENWFAPKDGRKLSAEEELNWPRFRRTNLFDDAPVQEFIII